MVGLYLVGLPEGEGYMCTMGQGPCEGMISWPFLLTHHVTPTLDSQPRVQIWGTEVEDTL